jgi:hypothetical protein
MILGAVWSRKQSGNGNQSRESSAIEASIRVLDFCGQRNAFARKYGNLIKDLWQHLDGGLPNTGGDAEYTSSASSTNFMNLSITESQAVGAAGPSDHQSRASRSSQSSEDVRRGYDPSQGLLDARINSWSEQFGAFYQPDDLSPYGMLL